MMKFTRLDEDEVGPSREDSSNYTSFDNGPKFRVTMDSPKHDGAYRASEDVDSQVLKALAKYDDFHTIDWLRDRVRDRDRYREICRMLKRGSVWDKIKASHDAWSGWLVMILIGVVAGLTSGFIDISSKWLSDLKVGICTSGLWFSKQECCWSSEQITHEESCENWKTWASVFGSTDPSSSGAYMVNYMVYIVMALTFSTTAAVMVRKFAPYACGSGITEIKTILGGFIIHGFMGFWTYFIKALGLIPSVASGLNLGQEGPMVHIGCCISNIMVRFFPKYNQNEAKKREVISAGAAAGVAVAFGAPIGGVLFSLEEVSYYFPLKTLWRTFFCCLIAAFMRVTISPYYNAHNVLFYIDYNEPWKLFELIPFIMLGVIGGAYGAFFTEVNLWFSKLRKTTKLGKYPLIEILVITFITAVVSFPNPYTRQSSHQLMHDLFKSCNPTMETDLCDYIPRSANQSSNINPLQPHESVGAGVTTALWQLSVAFVVKGLLSVFTFGLKVPAGLFIPSLAVGSCIGRIIGIGVEMLTLSHPDWYIFKEACGRSVNRCVTPGLYAIVGAAACLAGVTRMTVTLVVIMFELTGGLVYMVPIMVSVMVAKWVGDALSHVGIYERHIQLSGYPFLNNKEEFDDSSLARDIMKPRQGTGVLICLPAYGMTLEELEQVLESTTFNGYPVVQCKGSLAFLGIVTRRDLLLALSHEKSKQRSLTPATNILFIRDIPADFSLSSPCIQLAYISDLSPIVLSDSTPTEIVIEIFRKLGVRQVLIASKGELLGIITKKDILRHIAVLEGTVRFS